MIVTRTPERAEALRQTIVLRGFDEIACLDAQRAVQACRANPPALVIVDKEGDLGLTLRFLEAVPAGVKSLVLADVFDEALFLACHDHGAKDFMVKPVPEAMLISRVIRNLQDHRLEQVARQKDKILVDMGVLSPQSGVFTTSYLINLVREQMEALNPNTDDPISLLILQMEGLPSPMPSAFHHQLLARVGAVVKECARGLDEVGEYFVDKFAVVMPQTSRRGAKALANRLQQRLHGMMFEGVQTPWALSVRVGVAESGSCRNYEELLSQAMDDLKADLKGAPAQPVAVAPVFEPVAAQVSVPAQPVVQPVAPEQNLSSPNIPPMSRPSNLI